MRMGRGRGVGVAILAAMCLGISPSGWADGPQTANTRVNGIFHKLGRGIANIVTCPLELLRVPMIVSRKDGNLAGWSVGVVKGAAQTIGRGVAGVYEVLTFYAEIPDDYAPLIKPEFVWAHGNWAE